jgi:hypothetical protein
MASIDYLDKGNPDGTILGQAATSKVGFYAATPVVRQATAAAGTDAATTQALANALRTALLNYGLIG